MPTTSRRFRTISPRTCR
uniref:Uncharacterized protein n=1 Tax=Rhizophora mucronata TaxID=61149 RepID=A0A2P2P8P8_RHIMU